MKLFVSQTLPTAYFRALSVCGFEPVPLPPFSLLPPPVASHADMLLFDLGDSLLMHREYYEQNRKLFQEISVCLSKETIGKCYPNDILFNALKTDDLVYGLEEHLSLYIRHRFPVKRVKQGYAKCSVCRLHDNAFITADPSMACALKDEGKNVLVIQSGHISLPGYGCGFIGGTTFVFEKTLYTFGSLTHHPDGAAITEFAVSNGFSVHPLSDALLFDVGGALPLLPSLKNMTMSNNV